MKTRSRFIHYIVTLYNLGIQEVVYVFWYRITLWTGIRKYWFPMKKFQINEDVFIASQTVAGFPDEWKSILLKDAERIIEGQVKYYSFHWKLIGNPPDWFKNPFNGKNYPKEYSHWIKLPDYHSEVGDIKNVWEASRFEWVVTLARAYAVTGKLEYLNTLNSWLKDWVNKNPLNTGPNWKCGQEASIRVFNLMNASFILGQSGKPSKALSDLIFAHLLRIRTNIGYALAQNNNHGTSEAAALFIGGRWLLRSGYPSSRAKQFELKGRNILENRMRKLVENDGGFSQNSVNYHRVLLDTLCFAEFWRIQLNAEKFSAIFYKKSSAAIEWLWSITDDTAGNCPNLGSNDGARFLNMHSCSYLDFRPTLQTASVLFDHIRRFDHGIWDEPLFWFKIQNSRREEKQKKSKVLESGYVVLRTEKSWCLLRFPRYKFRPTHNDVFHIDLWSNGENILPDAGSFSYFPNSKEHNFNFRSVHAHNTVSFDTHDPIPRFGGFLLGGWIRPGKLTEIKTNGNRELSWEGNYSDAFENKHIRKISYTDNSWIIEDQLSGQFRLATIGFNLLPKKVLAKENVISTSWGSIVLPQNTTYELKTGYASSYYWEKHEVTRLTILLDRPQKFITTIKLSA